MNALKSQEQKGVVLLTSSLWGCKCGPQWLDLDGRKVSATMGEGRKARVSSAGLPLLPASLFIALPEKALSRPDTGVYAFDVII